MSRMVSVPTLPVDSRSAAAPAAALRRRWGEEERPGRGGLLLLDLYEHVPQAPVRV